MAKRKKRTKKGSAKRSAAGRTEREAVSQFDPELLAAGLSTYGFRVDDPKGEGLGEGRPASEEALSFLPDDLRAAVVEEGIAVDVVAFHPALLPMPLLIGNGRVQTPEEALKPDEEGVFTLVPAAYRSEVGETFFSLAAFRERAAREVGFGAGVDRFYSEVKRLIRAALADCRRRCRALEPIDCSEEERALAAAQDGLVEAQRLEQEANDRLAEARARRDRLRRRFESFARAISDPEGPSEVVIGGVTLGFPSAAAAGQVLDGWADEIGQFQRALARVEREIDRLEAEVDAAEAATERARDAVNAARRALAACRGRQRRRRREIRDCRRRCAELERLLAEAGREQAEARRKAREARRRRERERRERERRQREAVEEERRRRQSQPPAVAPPPLPRTVTRLPEPQELEPLQIRNGLFHVLKDISTEFPPIDCPGLCWGALKNASAIASDLIRRLGWDLIGTFLSFLPVTGTVANLVKGFAEAVAKFAGSDTLSEGALKAVVNALGGEIFGKVLGDLASTAANNLSADNFAAALKQAIEDDGIRIVEVSGEKRRGSGGACHARARSFYNPATGRVVMIGRCDCCPGVFIVRYKANSDGFPVGRVRRRVVR